MSLPNISEERFARFAALGHSNAEAAQLAGYACPITTGSRLAAKPRIAERVRVLERAVALIELSGVDPQDIVGIYKDSAKVPNQPQTEQACV